MNNGQIQGPLEEEPQVDMSPMLRKRQEEIVSIIEALDHISQSQYWSFLEKNVFKPVLDSAVNQVCIEKDQKKVFHLQGKIEVLNRYADFKQFSDAYRMELKKIDSQLKVSS